VRFCAGGESTEPLHDIAPSRQAAASSPVDQIRSYNPVNVNEANTDAHHLSDASSPRNHRRCDDIANDSEECHETSRVEAPAPRLSNDDVLRGVRRSKSQRTAVDRYGVVPCMSFLWCLLSGYLFFMQSMSLVVFV